MRKSSPTKHLGLLILRVSFSAAMLTHGWPKLQKLLAGGQIKFADPIGIGELPSLILAVLGEFVFPILIIIGLKTRLAAIPAAITMAVAFFIVHSEDAFGDKEMSFIYLAAFITIALLGAGKYSLDGYLSKGKRKSH